MAHAPRLFLRVALPCLVLAACPGFAPSTDREPKKGSEPTVPAEDVPGKEVVQAPVKPEEAPPATERAKDVPPAKTLAERVRSFFDGRPGRRLYVQVDKPLYKPGETVWIKSWDLKARDLGGDSGGGLHYELVSPKGATVLEKNVQEQRGTATNDFEIPEGVQGGEYLIRVTAPDGAREERPIIVSTYEPPRLKKKLEFVRKAYGAGDEVSATIKVERPTGEPLGNHALEGLITLDGEALPPVKVTTNAEGGAVVKFKLPSRIEKGDGLLTVMVDDGGVTESVSKRIPILLKKLDFAFFPEGGQLVTGVPTRVYFEAKNTIGKPADVEGRIVDDRGNAVASFSTWHFGLGRIELTPSTNRKYQAEITKPAGISEKYPLPVAAEAGCVLRTYDDPDGQLPEIRASVRCSEARRVIVFGMLRENVIDSAAVQVPADGAAVVYLKSSDDKINGAQGVARITVFDEDLNPLAERLFYRGRRNALNVEITPDKANGYTPREQVALTVKTTDGRGQPVPAEVAVSVVDDTVISFADDKTGHMLSRLFLEPEIADKVEEPNFFFDLTKAKSAVAMDMLLGTRGYRRFEWQPVVSPPPPPPPTASATAMPAEGMLDDLAGDREGGARPKAARPMRPAGARPQPPPPPAAPPPVARAPMPDAKPAKGRADVARDANKQVAEKKADKPMDMDARAGAKRKEPAAAGPPPAPPAQPAIAAKPMPGAGAVAQNRARRQMAAGEMRANEAPAAEEAEAPRMAKDEDWAGADKKEVAAPGWAPVRVFPAPTYRGDEVGPRTDFRETIHWAPTVVTGRDGRGIVTFFLSDAVTSFRVFAEGAGGGFAGRGEKVFKSSLPFSMSVKLPLEVSAGDKFLIPLTLTNDRDKPTNVSLDAAFGDMVAVESDVPEQSGADGMLTGKTAVSTDLGAGARKSIYYPVAVKGMKGKSKITVAADAGGLKDEFVRELEVVPIGFPQVFSHSGTLKDRALASVDLGEAIEGSVTATIKLYPTPVATMISGLDGMLREPSGCFEQTSSTNYPNIMVMQYLKANDVADPDLVDRTSQLLDRGYKRLVGFETPNKGYEWFGQNPPHEALTSYGLLEFTDLKQVYGGVDEAMMARTKEFIRTRKNGKGGFLRDPKALDSFGGAKAEVTDAYIVYALTEAGFTEGFDAEIAVQSKVAATDDDPYLVALAANSMLNIPARKGEGQSAAKRLAAMQKDDGRWMGKDHSITRSTGINLDIETTSLSLLAMMKAGGEEDRVRKGVEWLNNNRGGFGSWNATQATVLALKALAQYANVSRRTPAPGQVNVVLNGQVVAKASYEAGRREPLEIGGFGASFGKGANKIELVHDGKADLPFSVAVEYRTVKPASSPNVVVDLSTKLEKTTVKMGENVRLTAKVTNKTANGQPMTIARIGLPGGLTFQTWQLKELKDKGLAAFTETRAREVIVYFRDLKPNEVKEIPLDLVALIPGDYTGPASSAYLYYTDDAKVWTDGLKVTVTR